MPSYLPARWIVPKHDGNVCPVCLTLEKTANWILNSDIGIPDVLTDEFYGPVWDTWGDKSLAHEYLPNPSIPCRCRIQFDEPDCTDLQATIKELIEIYRVVADLTMESIVEAVGSEGEVAGF
jgi:hypothetical protein